MPSQTFVASSTTDADLDHAWLAMQHVDTWAGVAGVDRVHSPSHTPDGALRSFAVDATVAGVTHPGRAVVRASDPPTAMQIEVTTRDMLALVDVTLTAGPGGCAVDVAMAVSTRTLLSGMFFPAVASAIEASIDRTVEDFAGRLGTVPGSR